MEKYSLEESLERRAYLENELIYSHLQLSIITDINKAIIKRADVGEIIILTINRLYENFPYFRVAYSVIDGRNLQVIYSLAPKEMNSINGLYVDLRAVPDYLAALSNGQLISINDMEKSGLLGLLAEKSIFKGVRAILDVPFQHIKGLTGLVCFGSATPRNWLKSEIELLHNISISLAVAIKEANAQEEKSVYEKETNIMFSSSTEMFCIAGEDGYFKRLSPAFEKVLGYSLSELYSIPYIEFIHPDDREKTLDATNKFHNRLPKTYFENRYRCKDGSYKWLVWNAILGLENEFTNKRYATARDITEEKRIYTELETLSLVASKTDNAVILVDKNGCVEWVNEGFTRLTGYLQLEVLGKTPEEILQGPNSEVTTGIKTTTVRRPFNEKIPGYNKKGEPYWVSISITPIFDQNGEIDRFIIIETNITKQHLVENKVLENEARLSGIIESAMDAIITFDSQGKILVFNSSAERVFLCPTETALEKNVNAFIPEFNRYENLEEIPSFLSNISGMRSDKEEFPIEATISRVSVGKEKLNAIILRDITDRRLSEKRLKEYALDLEKINKELDQFAYVVSHDLKAPLRGISHLSEWLEEDLADLLTPDTRHKMGLIRNRVNRMEALINAILQYSRIGRVQTIENVKTRDLVEEIIEDLEPLPNFSFYIKGEMPILETEKILLTQVFTNLISNAMKYNNREKGLIEIGLRETKNSFYEFFVKDDGIGIDKRYHEKIFVIFQTLEAKNNVESTGVGLAIVKKIVESQGGNVWLESEIGIGTTFYFTWPIEVTKKKHKSSS